MLLDHFKVCSTPKLQKLTNFMFICNFKLKLNLEKLHQADFQ